MQIFRNMIEQDIAYVAELEEKVFSDPWTVQGIYETFSQKHAFVVVAEYAKQIVGYCIVYCIMDEAEIVRIAVDESVRRQGVGGRLLDYVCGCCAKQNVGRLLLDVRANNVGARAFYERYGFVEDGVRKNFYEQPQEDAVLMSMNLG